MSPLKALFFDFDGTLVDSAPGILRTMQETFKSMQLSVPESSKMKATIGMPLKDALRQLGDLSNEQAEEATQTYRQLFPRFEAQYVTLFEGVRQTLEKLQAKGLRLAIVTSRDLSSLELILSHHDLGRYFETQVNGADGLRPKPDGHMAEVLLRRMNLKKEEALVVGDTTFDMLMGKNAGLRTLAVSYGNHSKAQLRQVEPTHIVDSFPEILEYIEGL